jgi:hypothetical protein
MALEIETAAAITRHRIKSRLIFFKQKSLLLLNKLIEFLNSSTYKITRRRVDFMVARDFHISIRITAFNELFDEGSPIYCRKYAL